jgi:CHASE2 domain-containing sensor protein
LKKLRFISWDNLFATAVVFGVLQFLPILFSIDFLDPINNTIEDFNAADVVFARLKDYDAIKPDTNVVLVNIGYLNRQGIADLLNIINANDPLVVGIDTFFPLPKEPELDSALAQALRNTKNLILVSEAKHLDDDMVFDTVIYSHIMFTKYAKTGFANLVTDDNSGFRVVRSISPTEIIDDSLRLFFAVEVAKYLDSDKVKKFVARNNDIESVNYKRNIYNGGYKALDINDVFNKQDELSFLKGKIVLLGFLGPDINTIVFEDIFFTPMNPNYLGKAFPDMYGVVIHANVISMIMEEDFIMTIPFWLKIVITFFIVYFNMALFNFIERRYENVYEMANLFIILTELVILFNTMIACFYFFKFDLGLREATLFGIIFSATGFELYHGSFKPITMNMVNKIQDYRIKRASEKLVTDFTFKEDKEEQE